MISVQNHDQPVRQNHLVKKTLFFQNLFTYQTLTLQ